MGKHIDELIRLGRLGSGRTPIDVSAALDYHKANREAIMEELKELALANPAPPVDSHTVQALSRQYRARKKLEG